MTKKKLLEDIKQNPTRIYRSPGDILRDRRLGDADRLEVLRVWRGTLSDAAPEAADIDAMIVDMEGRICSANDHAAE
jgi:hypothetical protein